MEQLQQSSTSAHLVGGGDHGAVGQELDDFLGGGVAEDQILLELAQLNECALIDLPVYAARDLHMHRQPRQLLPAGPMQVSKIRLLESTQAFG